jgi:hypothetical protein
MLGSPIVWRRCTFYRRAGVLFLLLLAGLTTSSARAGGGPENVFLVVNPKSGPSMEIANFYIHARQIPSGNVLYLPWDAKVIAVDVEGFRTGIMKPILEAIRARRLISQIDYVVYSSDLPLEVGLDADIEKFKNMPAVFKVKGTVVQVPKQALSAPTAKEWKTATEIPKKLGESPDCTPKGSLTGMTYLWPWVMQNAPDYLTWQCNRYMRMPIDGQKDKPSLSFRSSWRFGESGELVEKDGASYMLSAMLGVTAPHGNTVAEVLNYLERSAHADGTHPKGTIYFMKNDDVRSLVRDRLFPEADKDLEKLGIDAKIVTGTVPLDRRDVQGVCMGTADFKWKESGSTILPGALCENFTSYGAVFGIENSQTLLTEYLRYGAAGASGTVVEPYASWQKFPVPQIQVHYARGCTLAEAYYQSVFGPYQLLVVGDPLCRPWANIPKVEAKGIKDGDEVKGELVVTPSATVPHDGAVDRFELFVNGARAAQCKPGETLKLDTTLLPDGDQEIRVVAVENSMIQSQGRAIFHVAADNNGRKIAVRGVPIEAVKAGEKIKLNVKSPGSIGVAILQNSRLVGRIAGEEGAVEVAADELGAGRVWLQAVGIGKGGPKSNVMSRPLQVEVDLNK